MISHALMPSAVWKDFDLHKLIRLLANKGVYIPIKENYVQTTINSKEVYVSTHFWSIDFYLNVLEI